MEVLPEHVGGNEGQPALGDTEATFPVRVVILANDGAGLDIGAPVDYGPTDMAILADVDLRKDD